MLLLFRRLRRLLEQVAESSLHLLLLSLLVQQSLYQQMPVGQLQPLEFQTGLPLLLALQAQS